MHSGLAPLLAEAFRLRGYRVTPGAALEGRSGTVHTVGLLAEDDHEAVIVDELAGALLPDQVDAAAWRLEDVGATRMVLAHVPEAGPATLDAAARHGIALWDAPRLAALVGEAALAAATPLELGALPFAPPAPPIAPVPSVPDPALPQSVSDLLPAGFLADDGLAAQSARAAEDSPGIPTFLGVEVAAAEEPLVLEPFPPLAVPASPSFVAQPLAAPPAPAYSPVPAPPVRLQRPAGVPQESPAYVPGPAYAAPGPGFSPPVLSAAPVSWPGLAAPSAVPQAFVPTAVPVASPPPAAYSTQPAGARLSPIDPATGVRGSLPLRIQRDDAVRRVRDHLFTIDVQELVLQPVHLYDYACDLFAEGSLKVDSHEGRLQVHGTDKRATEVDPDDVNPTAGTSAAPAPEGVLVSPKVLRVSPERALELAQQKVIELHTRLVDHKLPQENHSFHYVEKRKLSPRPEHIRLKPLGAWYRPFWRMAGTNGEMLLDGVTGAVATRDLRTNPDAFILD